jgi:hypothetical protein
MQPLSTPLQRYVAEHRLILDQVAAAAGFAEPVAVELDKFRFPLLRRAKKGPVLPLKGVLIRDWDPDLRVGHTRLPFGMRVYQIEGVRFVEVNVTFDCNRCGDVFTVVDRRDYRKLYRIVLRCRKEQEAPVEPPVMSAGLKDAL